MLGRLLLESLEERTLPAIFGVPWVDPQHLTLSFAPDGTSLGGVSSDLSHLLGASNSSAWEHEILRAFQTWADAANLNIGVVPDNGLPFDSPGPVQGNPNFGDLRIGATTLSRNDLAVGTPFDLGDSWSGSVLFNDTKSFGIRAPGKYDLFSVALHEAGHALGVGHSDDPNSPMYDQYLGPRDQLASSDKAAIQALYGARPGHSATHQADGSRPLTFITDANSLADETDPNKSAVKDADLVARGDHLLYRFVVPQGVTTFNVALRTSGISLLTAKMSVWAASYEADRVVVQATDPLAGDLNAPIHALPGSTWYVKVEAAADDAYAIGRFHLAVGTQTRTALAAYGSGILPGHGDTLQTALKPKVTSTTNPADSHALTTASLTSAQEVQWYRFKTPTAPAQALTVTAWALASGTFQPKVQVFDAQGHVVRATLLYKDSWTARIQILKPTPGATYYVRVTDQSPSTFHPGNYKVSIDTLTEAITLSTFATGVLDATHPVWYETLRVKENSLVHLELASKVPLSADVAIRMTLFDSTGHVVTRLISTPNAPAVADLWLAMGTYTVRMEVAIRGSSQLPPVSWSLKGTIRSDPIGLDGADPTFIPPSPPPPGSPPGTDPPALVITVSGGSNTDPGNTGGSGGSSGSGVTYDPFSAQWWIF